MYRRKKVNNINLFYRTALCREVQLNHRDKMASLGGIYMNEVNRDVRAAWLGGEKVYQMTSTLMSQMKNLIGFNNEKLSSHWSFSRRGMQINAVDANGNQT